MNYFSRLTTCAIILSQLLGCMSKSVQLVGPSINISGSQDGGYPRAIQLRNGSLLATYSHPSQGIVVRASHDSGATWGPPATVLAPSSDTDENNQFLFQKVSGEVLCAYRRNIHQDGALVQANLEVSHSGDGGAPWAFLSSIVSLTPNTTDKGDWEPFLWHDAVTNKLEAYWAHEMWNTPEKKNPQQDTVKKVSPDGGKTWGPILSMTGANSAARDGMPNIAALDDSGKKLMMVYESNRDTPQLKIWASTSSDGGASWGHSKKIFDPEGKYAGGPGIVNANGTMVVSFMTNMDAPAKSKDKDMKVITSSDKGKTWSGATKVMTNGSWGRIAVVDDGMLVVAAHNKKASGQKIILVD